jgi:hypothetical protein
MNEINNGHRLSGTQEAHNKDTDFIGNNQTMCDEDTSDLFDQWHKEATQDSSIKRIQNPNDREEEVQLQPAQEEQTPQIDEEAEAENAKEVEEDADKLNGNYNLSTDGLPKWAQDVVNDIAEVRQCPRDFAIASLFVAVSGAVGNRVHVHTNLGDYDNPLMLWMVIAAPSGSNKSQPIADMLDPLSKKNDENYKDYKMRRKEWEDNGMKGDKPHYDQLIISDTTPEARNSVLSNNPNGVTCYCDEIAEYIDNFNRYNNSGEVSQMLGLFNGKTIRVNRKGDEEINIPNPFMNIIGSIQPSILKNVFGNRRFISNGFTARFLFCYKDTRQPIELTGQVLNESIKITYNWCIQQLLITGFGDGILKLSNEAEEVCNKFNSKCQLELDECDDFMQCIIGKLQFYVLRLAGVVQLMWYIRNPEPSNFLISGDTMRYAVKCMEYFKYNAEKVYEVCRDDAPRPLTRDDTIRAIHRFCPKVSNTEIAKMFDLAKQRIGQILKK